MFFRSIPVVLLLGFLCTAPSVSSAAGSEAWGQKRQAPNREALPKEKAVAGSVTSVVKDQGRYVLVDEVNLKLIADLGPAIPTESFAKHIGNTVTVRGTVNAGGPRPVMKVRTIEKVCDGCKGPAALKV